MPATADVLKTLGIWRSRGCRAGLQYHAKSMSIPVRITRSQRRPTTRNTNQYITSAVNATAVKHPRKQGKRCLTRIPANSVVPCTAHSCSTTNSANVSSLSSCLINIRSLKRKALLLHEFICDNAFDLVFITETWSYADESDLPFVLQAVPDGYNFIQCPRKDNTGYGGVAVIFKDCLCVKRYDSYSFQAVEVLVIHIKFLVNICCLHCLTGLRHLRRIISATVGF